MPTPEKPPTMTHSVAVPATSANLGPGFDTLGLALGLFNTLAFGPAPDGHDRLTFEPTPYAQRLQALVGAAARASLPFVGLDAAWQAAARQQPGLGPRPAWHCHVTTQLPLARGLGSSSAVLVGGLCLANAWLGQPLSTQQLLALAVEVEGHADNVAPALLGGVQCWSGQQAIAVPWPEATWCFSVLIPSLTTSTEASRRQLPLSLPRATCVAQGQALASWLMAAHTADEALLRYALTNDHLHEPQRGAALGLPALRQALLADADVLGVVLSGSGPTALIIHKPTWQPAEGATQHGVWANTSPLGLPLVHGVAQVTSLG
jgi:homoserine kinase